MVDANGYTRRTLTTQGGSYVVGAAAESISADEHRVRVHTEQTISGLDFSNLASTGSISGVQFVDVNANGVLDSGEDPLAGVTVYVDLNANQYLDSGEPFAISDAAGQYTIHDVQPGTTLVRTISPSHYRPSVSESIDRLFATQARNDSTSPWGYYLTIVGARSRDGIPHRNSRDPITGRPRPYNGV